MNNLEGLTYKEIIEDAYDYTFSYQHKEAILSVFAELEAAKVGSITIDLKGTDIERSVAKQQNKRITELEKQIKEARYEAIGWTHAFCCTSLDKGLDPRKADVAEMLKQAKKDLTKEERK